MRYAVTGPRWANERFIGPALTPPYIGPGQAVISYGPVTYHPGNQDIPVGHSNVDQGIQGLMQTGVSRSSDAPDYFRPRFGYQVATEQVPVSRFASFRAPVPSTPPARVVPMPAKTIPRLGGIAQIGQPQAVPRWPSLNRLG
jgi:hypothetical protein